MSVTWQMSGLKRGRPLAAKMLRHRLAVRRVGGEAVDGLRRQRDELAGAQHLRRLRDGGGEIGVVEDDAAQRR